MAITHKHHIIPKHMGGTDDPTNLVEVSIEKHAELHKQLWEDLGDVCDYIAWKSLAGIMNEEERIELLLKAACSRGGKVQGPKNKGWKPSEKTRQLWSEQRKGRPGPNTGKRWKDSLETRKRKSEAKKGKPKPQHFAGLVSTIKSKVYIVHTPSGEIYTITNLKSFCKQHGLSESLMYKVANGFRNHHRRYKCYHHNEGNT